MSASVPTLRNGRVQLGPLQMSNIYQHFEWNNDPELNRLDSEMPFARESFGPFKRRFEQMVEHPTEYATYFEILASDGTLIGIADVVGIDRHNRHCSVSLTLGDRDYWGKGYGRASMALLLSYCFENLGMHRVSAEAFAFNDAWKRLVEGTGFSKEGAARDYRYLDDRYWDKLTYAMLAGEYEDEYGTVPRNTVSV